MMPADVTEVKKVGSLQKKRCLHKGLTIGDQILIVGGTDFDKIEVFDKNNIEAGSNEYEDSHSPFIKALRMNLESVTYNAFYLKKCSNA